MTKQKPPPRRERKGEMTERPKREPEFDAERVRDVSEAIYRARLADESGEGAAERMIAKDGDNGEKLRRRAGFYDALTRAYMRVLKPLPSPPSSEGGA